MRDTIDGKHLKAMNMKELLAARARREGDTNTGRVAQRKDLDAEIAKRREATSKKEREEDVALQEKANQLVADANSLSSEAVNQARDANRLSETAIYEAKRANALSEEANRNSKRATRWGVAATLVALGALIVSMVQCAGVFSSVS